jgi:integrase
VSKKLTVKSIENLKPGATRREVPDGTIRGLYLAIQPSGSKSYVLRYRHASRPRKLTIGGADIGLGEAHKLATKALAEIAGGKDPAAERKSAKAEARMAAQPARDLVETVVADFIEKHVKRANKPSTAREYVRLLNKEIVGPWRGKRLSEISRRNVNILLDDIVDRGAPVAANRVFAIFRKVCRWAVSREILEHSPCDGVQARTPEQPRDRVLDDRELGLVWRASESLGWPFEPIVKLLLLTGQRRGEVVGMKWAEIDLTAATWTIPSARAKNKRQHVVPLASQAVQILKWLPRIAGHAGFVFPRTRERAKGKTTAETAVSGFSRTKTRLDAAIRELLPKQNAAAEPLPPWSLHDLRRSCASGLARIGIDLPVIERCLNHVSGSFGGIVSVYQKHKFEDDVRRALDAWAAHIERIASDKPPANVVQLAAVWVSNA